MVKRIVTVFMFLLATAGVLSVLPLNAAEARARTICSNEPIPKGYVITRVLDRNGCGNAGSLKNARTIDQPRNGLIACDVLGSPQVPSPFVITARRDTSNCTHNPFVPNRRTNSVTINEARHNLIVCDGSQPPTGFSLSNPGHRIPCIVDAFTQPATNSFVLRGRANILALAATGTPDGVLHQRNNVGAFALATINSGAGSRMRVSTRTNGIIASVVLCETNPITAQCLRPASSSVTTRIEGGETPTFSVFVGTAGSIPLDPSSNNVIVQFRDESGSVRGSVSVPVTTN